MLKIENISKRYGDKEVLKNITFSINNGEIVSLIGNNGSGKTTLFKIICNLLEKDEGEITFNQQPITEKKIGFLPEERSLYYDCSIEQQLKLICQMNNFDDSDQQIDFWLEKLGLEDKRKEKVLNLSKGNQQKVALAMCLIKQPEIIILDEPFTGLDVSNIELFEQIIQEEINSDKIIFISTHIYDPVNRLCDRYLVLDNGNIKINMTKEELKNRPQRIIVLEKEIEVKDYINCFCHKGKMRYVYENEEKALKEVRSLIRRKERDYSYGSLTIEDMVNML